VYQAVIAEKVALIDRLPAKYRREARELVWHSVMNGYDDVGLAHELHERFGLIPERARLLATIQCKMARSVIENARNIEIGVREAIWCCEQDRCPSPSHQGFNGQHYGLVSGAHLDGKRVWPGSEPDCLCASVSIDVAEIPT